MINMNESTLNIDLFIRMTDYLVETDWADEFETFYYSNLKAVINMNNVTIVSLFKEINKIPQIAPISCIFTLEQFFCQKIGDGRSFIDDYIKHNREFESDEDILLLEALNSSEFGVYAIDEAGDEFVHLTPVNGERKPFLAYSTIPFVFDPDESLIAIGGVRVLNKYSNPQCSLGVLPFTIIKKQVLAEAMDEINRSISIGVDMYKSMPKNDPKRFTDDIDCMNAMMCHLNFLTPVAKAASANNYDDGDEFIERDEVVEGLLSSMYSSLSYNMDDVDDEFSDDDFDFDEHMDELSELLLNDDVLECINEIFNGNVDEGIDQFVRLSMKEMRDDRPNVTLTYALLAGRDAIADRLDEHLYSLGKNKYVLLQCNGIDGFLHLHNDHLEVFIIDSDNLQTVKDFVNEWFGDLLDDSPDYKIN